MQKLPLDRVALQTVHSDRGKQLLPPGRLTMLVKDMAFSILLHSRPPSPSVENIWRKFVFFFFFSFFDIYVPICQLKLNIDV